MYIYTCDNNGDTLEAIYIFLYYEFATQIETKGLYIVIHNQTYVLYMPQIT